MPNLRASIVLSFVVSFAAALGGTPAVACGSAIRLETDAELNALVAAEQALEYGELDSARQWANKVWIRGDAHKRERADRVVALAATRDPRASDDDLHEAISELESQWKAHPTSIERQVDYGEVLARVGRKDEARAILEPAAERDLIGNAAAYAALVRIGSTLSIRLHALRMCHGMVDEARICRRSLFLGLFR